MYLLLLSYADDEVKLDALTTALRKVPSETSYYLDYIQDHNLDFSRACAYLRERALLKSTFDENETKRFHKATASDTPSDSGKNSTNLDFSQVFAIMQNWAEETDTDLKHVYATMNASPPLRESLMIPSKLWHKLAPEIKKAVLDARSKLIKEETAQHASKETNPGNSNGVPKQYTHKANRVSTDHGERTDEDSTSSEEWLVMMSTRACLKSSGLLLENDSSESDSDDTFESYSYMARSVDIADSYLLNQSIFNTSSRHTDPIVFVDGGADSCIGGVGWTPIVYTGRKANLVGYDDRHTRKSGLDICLLVTKVKP